MTKVRIKSYKTVYAEVRKEGTELKEFVSEEKFNTKKLTEMLGKPDGVIKYSVVSSTAINVPYEIPKQLLLEVINANGIKPYVKEKGKGHIENSDEV